MGNIQSRMNEIAIRDARFATDSLGRAVDDMARTTTKGLHSLNTRINNGEHCVQQMQIATSQGIQYVIDRTSSVEERQRQHEERQRQNEMVFALVSLLVIFYFVLKRFPHVLDNAVAFFKRATEPTATLLTISRDQQRVEAAPSSFLATQSYLS